MLTPAFLALLASATSPPPAAPPAAPAAEISGDSRAPVALLAGGLAGLLPLMAGSLLLAEDDRPSRQITGVYVMVAGFALAPVVAHAARGAWRRALLFGAVSLALSAATIGAMYAIDVFDPATANRDRLPFGALLTGAFATAAVGVVAAELAPAPEPAPAPAPALEPPRARLSLWLAPAAGGIAWSHPL